MYLYSLQSVPNTFSFTRTCENTDNDFWWQYKYLFVFVKALPGRYKFTLKIPAQGCLKMLCLPSTLPEQITMCKSNFKATKMKSFPAKSTLWLVWWTCWLNMEMQIVFLLFHWPPCLVSCIYANAPFQYPLIRSQTAAWHCVCAQSQLNELHNPVGLTLLENQTAC